MKITFFTREGLEKLQKEKEDLEKSRPEAVKELTRAREMGDLSENGFYKGARSKLSRIDSSLRRLTDLIKRARVIAPSNTGVITIGSTIILEHEGKRVEYFISGQYEANPRLGKISDVSPIGREVLGKKIGDKVLVETPSGKITYTILEVK